MRPALLLALVALIAAVVTACADSGSHYQTLGRRDADAILAGMAHAHQQSESLARTGAHPGHGL